MADEIRTTIERDIEAQPYSADEQRVVDWLRQRTPDIGAGDDPIGFLLASYDYVMEPRRSGRTFGGYPAAEVADLCDIHARAADQLNISYSETAAISRRARDAIRYLLGMEVPEDV